VLYGSSSRYREGRRSGASRHASLRGTAYERCLRQSGRRREQGERPRFRSSEREPIRRPRTSAREERDVRIRRKKRQNSLSRSQPLNSRSRQLMPARDGPLLKYYVAPGRKERVGELLPMKTCTLKRTSGRRRGGSRFGNRIGELNSSWAAGRLQDVSQQGARILEGRKPGNRKKISLQAGRELKR